MHTVHLVLFFTFGQIPDGGASGRDVKLSYMLTRLRFTAFCDLTDSASGRPAAPVELRLLWKRRAAGDETNRRFL